MREQSFMIVIPKDQSVIDGNITPDDAYRLI